MVVTARLVRLPPLTLKMSVPLTTAKLPSLDSTLGSLFLGDAFPFSFKYLELTLIDNVGEIFASMRVLRFSS